MIWVSALSLVTSFRLKLSTMSSMYSMHLSSGFRCSSSSKSPSSGLVGRGELTPVESRLRFWSCLTSEARVVRIRRSSLTSRGVGDSSGPSLASAITFDPLSSVRPAPFDPRVLADPLGELINRV